MATGDFFPLQVNYEEKMYAAGKFPGGFMKRVKDVLQQMPLTALLIDRLIRPMFAEGFPVMKSKSSIQCFLMKKMHLHQALLCGSHLCHSISDFFHFGHQLLGLVGDMYVAKISNPSLKNKQQSLLEF